MRSLDAIAPTASGLMKTLIPQTVAEAPRKAEA
jgi:hypothetical protein